jgi:hypothetical protein
MKIARMFKEECMTAKKTVVYECDVCGTEVTVNSEGMSNLSPIYCCGLSLSRRKNKPARKADNKISARTKTAARESGKKTTGKTSVQTAKKTVQRKRVKS